jgi:hypothetical protein
MHIRPKAPSKRSVVYEAQAEFLARCIRRLEIAFHQSFSAPYDPDAGDSPRFWAMPEYEVFHDAAYACGFVCDDFVPNFPIELANERPHETLGRESFAGLRHYIHTLLRAERSNRIDGYFSPVCSAIQSGALGVIATRLESDRSLYEPIRRTCASP